MPEEPSTVYMKINLLCFGTMVKYATN